LYRGNVDRGIEKNLKTVGLWNLQTVECRIFVLWSCRRWMVCSDGSGWHWHGACCISDVKGRPRHHVSGEPAAPPARSQLSHCEQCLFTSLTIVLCYFYGDC